MTGWRNCGAGSTAYQSSRTTDALLHAAGRQSLQEARLLATTGHTDKAIASYDDKAVWVIAGGRTLAVDALDDRGEITRPIRSD